MSAALRIFAFCVIIAGSIGLGLFVKSEDQKKKQAEVRLENAEAESHRWELKAAFIAGADAAMHCALKLQSGAVTPAEASGEINVKCEDYVTEHVK